jgi:uncharacterized protein with HEPN domain
MPRPDDHQAILFINDSIQLADLCLEARGTCPQYSDVVDAGAVRALTIIGELIKLLSPEVREKAPHIPFKDFAGMRDFLMHKPWDVDLTIVWNTIEHDLPVLQTALTGIAAVN